MKKWLKSLTIVAALVLTIIPCVLFSACGSTANHTPAEGDTYVFASVSCDDSAMKEMAEAMYKDSKLVFKADNKVEMIMTFNGQEQKNEVTYTIEDGKIKFAGSEEGYDIKGETLVVKSDDATITYELSK